jgi:hypothetical protein
MLPPVEIFPSGIPVEAYQVSTGLDACDPTEKPGVVDWRLFLTSIYGGNATDGIVRDCKLGGPSDHHAGRAYDWMRLASVPAEASQVEEVIAWLLSTDPDGNEQAMFRRVGLTYMIWNRQVWSTRTRQWLPYEGTDPHTNHVHFSFGGPGSRGETSFFSWESPGAFQPVEHEPQASPWTVLACLVALGGGLVAGHYAVRAWAAKSSRIGFGMA